MLKVEVRGARVRVTARFRQEGSVLQGTVRAACIAVDAHLELESNEATDRVATLVERAEAGCFLVQSLRNPVRVTTTAVLNGRRLDAPVAGDAAAKGSAAR